MIDDNETVNDKPEDEMELTETVGDPAASLAPGFHVYVDGEHNSGPYLTEGDARAFIDGYIGEDANGEVREIV